MVSAGSETTKPARIFLGLKVPARTQAQLRESIEQLWPKQTLIPSSNWHVTLLYVGEIMSADRLIQQWAEPLPITFVPTVKITHLGRGIQPGQGWLYVLPTRLLKNLRQDLIRRVEASGVPLEPGIKEFVPHIKVANLDRDKAKKIMADQPLTASWRTQAIQIFESQAVAGKVRYLIRGEIPLT